MVNLVIALLKQLSSRLTSGSTETNKQGSSIFFGLLRIQEKASVNENRRLRRTELLILNPLGLLAVTSLSWSVMGSEGHLPTMAVVLDGLKNRRL